MTTSDPSGHAFERAHAALLGRTDLQFDFPAYHPPVVPEWLLALGHLLTALFPLLKWVFWGVVALSAALVLFLLAREIWRFRMPVRVTRETSADLRQEWRPTRDLARILLQDADRLAAQGRYAEAVHLLLLRSIQDIDEKRPRLLRPALTSREIGSLEALPESARGAFAEIARVVELNRFGGRPVSADDFARCRSDYERFAFPDLWQNEQRHAA